MDAERFPAKSRRAHQCDIGNADGEIGSLRSCEFGHQLHPQDRISFTFLETQDQDVVEMPTVLCECIHNFVHAREMFQEKADWPEACEVPAFRHRQPECPAPGIMCGFLQELADGSG